MSEKLHFPKCTKGRICSVAFRLKMNYKVLMPELVTMFEVAEATLIYDAEHSVISVKDEKKLNISDLLKKAIFNNLVRVFNERDFDNGEFALLRRHGKSGLSIVFMLNGEMWMLDSEHVLGKEI